MDTVDKLVLLTKAIPAAFYRPNKAADNEWIISQGGSPGSRSKGDHVWFESEAPLRISIGGNRAGKTTKLVLEAGAMCIGCRPWYPQDSPWYTQGLLTRGVQSRGYARVRYVMPSFNVHLPEVIKEFKKWWPQDWWKASMSQQGQPRKFTFFNGSEILFMSHHMDAADFEGVEMDMIAWDEPPPRELWVGLQRGLVSTGGRAAVGATLLDASGWFWDEIVGQAGTEAARGQVLVTWHSIWDNTAENGGCPDQLADNVRRWLEFEISDADERLAREHGNPMHVGGLVLSSYSDAVNLIDPIKLPDDCLIVAAIDPAGSKPFAGLHTAYFMKDGQWEGHLFDETWVPQTKNDLSAFGQLWEAKEAGETTPRHPHRSDITIIDPFAEEPQKADRYGRSMRRILDEEYGIRTVLANRQGKRARLMQLNARFGQGRYKVWRTLKRFQQERRRWSWDQDSAKLTTGPDDVCDCATYIDASDPQAMLAGAQDESPGGVWRPAEYRERERRFAKGYKEARKESVVPIARGRIW